jgi:hypothetical protein
MQGRLKRRTLNELADRDRHRDWNGLCHISAGVRCFSRLDDPPPIGPIAIANALHAAQTPANAGPHQLPGFERCTALRRLAAHYKRAADWTSLGFDRTSSASEAGSAFLPLSGAECGDPPAHHQPWWRGTLRVRALKHVSPICAPSSLENRWKPSLATPFRSADVPIATRHGSGERVPSVVPGRVPQLKAARVIFREVNEIRCALTVDKSSGKAHCRFEDCPDAWQL